MNVSKAAEADAQGIAQVSSEVVKEGTVKELKPEEVKELTLSDHYYIAVAKVDGEIVGYALSSYSWDKLHVLDVAVKNSKRGMGVGKMLIKHLVSHAVEKGLPEAYCEVMARNIVALNLFTSLRFRFRLFSKLVGEGFYGLYLPLSKKI